mmetsp:Transcript_86392/g.241658  ORF Transcript_86392/g.241658 Transcript_86392/m.241658 type:complete len:281 (-) Transcript_86392:676-1518(-)
MRGHQLVVGGAVAHARLWLYDVEGLGDVLDRGAHDERRKQHDRDGRRHEEIAVPALIAAAPGMGARRAGDPQRQREGDGPPHAADPHHEGHVAVNLLAATPEVEYHGEWENVGCPRHDDDQHSVEHQGGMPVEAAQGEGRHDAEVEEDAGLRELRQRSKRHLRRHLRGLRQVVPVVVREDDAEKEERHDAAQTKELREGKRDVCREAHGGNLVIRESPQLWRVAEKPRACGARSEARHEGPERDEEEVAQDREAKKPRFFLVHVVAQCAEEHDRDCVVQH